MPQSAVRLKGVLPDCASGRRGRRWRCLVGNPGGVRVGPPVAGPHGPAAAGPGHTGIVTDSAPGRAGKGATGYTRVGMDGASIQPRFAADAMLGRLAKYLRILGYDTVWAPGRTAGDVWALADREGRLMLSGNRRLRHELPAAEYLLVPMVDPVGQLALVVRRLDLRPGGRLFSRCIRCNRLLEPLGRDEACLKVPEEVLQRYDRFFTCPGCRYAFWLGSHVRNTLRKLEPAIRDVPAWVARP